MAQLSTQDRQRIWRGLMRWWSNLREAVEASKAELLTTMEETDVWQDTNQSSYINSLTHKTKFTALQLTLIFCAVALMRVEPGIGALLRRVLGEVD